MTYNSEDTIFVQIPSYRDPELQHTLQDIFAKAKKPENIFVGICHQYDIKNSSDKHLFEIPFPHPNQIRIDEIDYRDTKGVSFARSRCAKMWNKEKWTLTTDAHMRFKENWDEILVLDIKKLKAPAILGNVVSKYCYKTGKIEFNDKVHASTIFFNNPEFRFYGLGREVAKISPGISALGSFTFADAKLINHFYADPFLESHDEIPNILRLFTYGANIFYYDKNILAHLFDYQDDKNLLIARSNTYKSSKYSYDAVLHLSGVKKTNDATIINHFKKNPLGLVRSIRDYERNSGVHFKKKKLRQHAKLGVFESWQNVWNKDLVKKLF